MDYKEKVIALLNSQELSNEQKEKLESIFPELKESEDERIRKEIIEYIKIGTYHKDWVAWLEKQGEKFLYWKPSEEQLEALDYAYNSCPDTERGNYYEGVLGTIIDDLHKLSEKQGEQKPDKVEPKFKVGDSIKTTNEEPLTITEITDRGYWSEDLFICGFDDAAKWELVEQKPANNVEPKFHEGDWIVYDKYDGNNIDKIVKFDNDKVSFESGEWLYIHQLNEDCKLWTIQDAKDGDVLRCESGWTCIFKALDNHTNTFSSYCFMDSDKWFCNTGSEGHTLDKAFIKAYNGEIYPATEEQCDLFFSKMKEAGYWWDDDKKELRMIERKHIWSEEDEDYYDAIIAKLEVTQEGAALTDNQMDFLKSLKDRYTWKPSDKQIHAFEQVYDWYNNNFAPSETLTSLYSDLKKLTE